MTNLRNEVAKGAHKIAEGNFSDVPSIPREILRAIEDGYSPLSPLYKYVKENNVNDTRISKPLVDALDRGYTPLTKVHDVVAAKIKNDQQKQTIMKKDFGIER